MNLFFGITDIMIAVVFLLMAIYQKYITTSITRLMLIGLFVMFLLFGLVTIILAATGMCLSTC